MLIEIRFHWNRSLQEGLQAILDAIRGGRRENRVMSNAMQEKLAALLEKVHQVESQVDSVQVFIEGLRQMLIDAEGNPEQVQQVIDLLDIQIAEMAEAILTTPPPVEPPPVEPPPEV